MKGVARAVAVLGAAAVAWVLFGEGPKDVVLVYDVGGDATRLEVELRRAGEVVRRAEFPVHPAAAPIRHAVKLPAGEYALGWRVATPSGPRQGERALEITEGGTLVLPIAR